MIASVYMSLEPKRLSVSFKALMVRVSRGSNASRLGVTFSLVEKKMPRAIRTNESPITKPLWRCEKPM